MALESQHRGEKLVEEESQSIAENLPLLFRLHEQIVLREPIDITEVFGKEPDQTVAFEVALAALVATAVLTVSTAAPIVNHIASLAAVLLLGLTLVRKMALDNAVIETAPLMQRTTGLMQYLIIFSVIYTGIFAAESAAIMVSGDVLVFLAVGVFVFTYALLLAYEFVFGDLFFWLAVTTHNRGVTGDPTVFNEGLLSLAQWVHGLSPYYHTFNVVHPAVRKVRFQGADARAQRARKVTASIVLVATIGVVVLGAILAIPILYWVTSNTVVYVVVLAVLLAAAALPLQGLLQFVLSRYGNASFEEVSGLWDDVLPVVVMVVVALVYEVERQGLLAPL